MRYNVSQKWVHPPLCQPYWWTQCKGPVLDFFKFIFQIVFLKGIGINVLLMFPKVSPPSFTLTVKNEWKPTGGVCLDCSWRCPVGYIHTKKKLSSSLDPSTPFQWVSCSSVQDWLIRWPACASPVNLVSKMNRGLWTCTRGITKPTHIGLWIRQS